MFQETGVYIPQQSRGGGPRPQHMNGSLGAHWKPGGVGVGAGAAFGDFFGMSPPGMMGKYTPFCLELLPVVKIMCEIVC